jgi:uncharacterized membrane protein (UPF0136 family)
MKTAGIVIFLYALIILIGGIIGHVKAESMASLIMGVAFGITLLAMSIATFKNKDWGYYIALILVFILDAFFTYRLAHTGRFMPSGMLCLISLAVLLILSFLMRRKIKSLLKN